VQISLTRTQTYRLSTRHSFDKPVHAELYQVALYSRIYVIPFGKRRLVFLCVNCDLKLRTVAYRIESGWYVIQAPGDACFLFVVTYISTRSEGRRFVASKIV
jgi:hypothetical protein